MPAGAARCYVYVDGQYVRQEFKSRSAREYFDPRKPAAFVQNIRLAGIQLTPVRIFYYDTINDQEPTEKVDNDRRYLKGLRRLPDTQVIEGQARQGTRGFEQKGVDVQLAVDALQAAVRGVVEAIALVSGDADFVPLARAVRDAGPHFVVIAFKRSLSPELRDAADRTTILEDPPTDWGFASEEYIE